MYRKIIVVYLYVHTHTHRHTSLGKVLERNAHQLLRMVMNGWFIGNFYRSLFFFSIFPNISAMYSYFVITKRVTGEFREFIIVLYSII